jgi:putative acetyltransferase
MHRTIRQFCVKDYSEEQVKVWSPDDYDQAQWLKRLQEVNPYVATQNNQLVGFADLQDDGYIDLFYCNHEVIGSGVGGALMCHIFTTAKHLKIWRLYSHVSITAKPFFEHFGFRVLNAQEVNVRGVALTNYVMERCLIDVR